MRPMGSSEGTMPVFARRLKNGRSWSDRGITAFIDFFVGLKDGLDIKTLAGKMENRPTDSAETKPPKHYVEKLKNSVGEAARQNVAYLHQATGKTIYHALKGLQGF
ncbi:UPF0236 family protein [Sporosarcina sp. Marseille-Q4063]|uniref:UPF0236 family transposase-like protein n=1 Tax=Sporosarcina sp. Marseille-Q4063 TaxID=2810514 RepID=UPI001BB0D0D5|nr:UPF0236 family protein [Sporosarcina sp. Marseille-Q4063]QUW21284.1 UPF0236 family protein [Sporosarcina sp. Marseille-Q4063]